ncbi:MAG TPA: tRNA dihydrouridine(20/20a) synthase DusA [Aliiroseovarius sp.]|nr:tRNA dihydrouridine(20/20a) synthase DusA [Aliiroseovarius sp.]
MTGHATDLWPAARLSVAPMMDWTDRHCRFFHRLMTGRALLYTEMVTAPALVRGGATHLLAFDPREQPVAVQLGGSDPKELAAATRLCANAGYREVNLNVGCPSDRVQSGAFGAVLMRDPGLVAECVSHMQDAAQGTEITVKCRIGVDDQEVAETLPNFLRTVTATGLRRVTIHARKAWLQGLSPKQNRDVPPLDYPLVFAMKTAFPALHVSLNGGVTTLAEARAHLAAGMDGVMIGRAAYHNPAQILLDADQQIFGAGPGKTAHQVAREMLPYIAQHVAGGGRVHDVTRHMLGLFSGRPGARAWRRMLSEGATKAGAGPELVEDALKQVPDQGRGEAAP